MPTSKGFTGQRADSGSSGLDYYGVRYYDPVLGQFASADTAQDGLNRYGYVHGNPTTASTGTIESRLCWHLHMFLQQRAHQNDNTAR